MNQVIQREAATVGLQVRQRRNRELLAELLDGYDLVDIGDSVPNGVDLCVVDEAGYRRCGEALSAWKSRAVTDLRPGVAPGGGRRGESLGPTRWPEAGTAVDAILQVPLPRRAILARIQSLLETRRYAHELASERELNRRIFDTSPVAKTVLDTDGTIVRANRRAEAVLGLEASAIEGMAYDDPDWKITDADGDPLPPGELPVETVLASGESVYGEELVIDRPDGERTWLSVSVSPLHDANGQIEYLVAAMDDVTEERRLERELRDSEELHRTTLENITDTVLITDDEGVFTYVCPNTRHIFGFDTEAVEALGDIKSLLGTDPAPDDLAAIGMVENVQLTVTDAAGAEHVVLATVKSVSIHGGERLYTLREITARAEMERELNETVQSRSIALEAADAGVWEWDIQADELTGDESLESITGTAAADVETLEELFGEIVHPDDVAPLEAAIERSVDRLDPFEVTVRVRTADGETRWLEARGRPLTDDTGAPTRLLGVAIDVTERVARERELERYERIVETAPEPIYALDAAGRITLANQAFADLFGLDRTEVVGANITDHLQAENVAASIEHIQALAEGEASGPLEMTIETVEGARVLRTQHRAPRGRR
ncbi:MAG: PAS domain S-box protein [Halobacteriales archaeon]|nr:PAS domain S-box protein [Halobacteriales archaeon]